MAGMVSASRPPPTSALHFSIPGLSARLTFRPASTKLMAWSAPSAPWGYKRCTDWRRSMEIHTLGIDLGKTIFHLIGLNAAGEVVLRKKYSPQTAAAVHGESVGRFDWHGSLLWLSFSWPGSSR